MWWRLGGTGGDHSEAVREFLYSKHSPPPPLLVPLLSVVHVAKPSIMMGVLCWSALRKVSLIANTYNHIYLFVFGQHCGYWTYIEPTLRNKLFHSPGWFQVKTIDIYGPKFDGGRRPGWCMNGRGISGLKGFSQLFSEFLLVFLGDVGQAVNYFWSSFLSLLFSPSFWDTS